jgi:hypothetical protein
MNVLLDWFRSLFVRERHPYARESVAALTQARWRAEDTDRARGTAR